MSEGSSAKEISLGDSFGEVAVKANGIRIELHADGSVDAYTAGAVKVHPAANDSWTLRDKEKTVGEGRVVEVIGAEIGDVMPAGHKQAGWIYMGPDEETGKDFYAAPKDESGTFTFNQAAKRAESIGAKMPSQSQLDKMYRNKDKGALKDTFNLTGSYPAGWYWSSSQYGLNGAWGQRFSDGFQFNNFKDYVSSLRCVR